MVEQCCVCEGKIAEGPLTTLLLINFVCPHNKNGGKALVHRGDCWTILWEAYSAGFSKARAQAGEAV